MAVCKGCGAEVTWVKTLAGKTMPIDPKPNPDGNLQIVDRSGAQIIVAVVNDTLFDDETTVRYTSHFATCPDADEFRRR